MRDASARAGRVTVVGVDGQGHIAADELLAAVGPDTALVHCQWGNHEVATLQPVAAVVADCRARGVLVHVDAAAAAGHVPIDFDELGADLLSVSAHKLGGPKGAGALLVRRGLRFPPLLVGGEQERGRRAGMEDVAAWVGFGEAAESLTAGLAVEAERARDPTDRLLAAALAIPGVGRTADDRPSGLPTSSASASTASRPRRCCSASTRRAWPPTPAAPARRSRWSPRPCWPPWASRPSAASVSRSAGRPPTTTSSGRARLCPA